MPNKLIVYDEADHARMLAAAQASDPGLPVGGFPVTAPSLAEDLAIRRMTVAEEAEAAARRFVDTGECDGNPHVGTPDESAWSIAFGRWLQALSVPESESSA